MQKDFLQSVVEGLIFSSDRAVSLKALMDLLEGVARYDIEQVLKAIAEKYQTNEHGIYLEEVAGGYHFRTKLSIAGWVQKFLAEKPVRMTRSQLETLAMVAYKQPVTRIDLDAIRGVDTSHILRTLLERKLIKIVGEKEVPGRPLLYATTEEFLEFFNLKDLDQLPSLDQMKDIQPAEIEQLEMLSKPS